MAYGHARRTTGYRRRRAVSFGGVSRRRTAATARRSAARAKLVSKKRASKPTVKKNAAAIRRLKRQAYGPIQRQVTKSVNAFTVHNDHPAFFQLSNPAFGNEGALIYRVNGTTFSYITKFDVDSMTRFDSGGNEHRCNGPKMFLKSVDLQFKFSGYVDNTRLRIDVVRQKTVAKSSLWAPSGTENFMPNNAHGFKRLAGFTVNTIDRSMFQVLKTKYVFINSKGTSNLVETVAATTGEAGQDTTTDPTTTNEKYCRLTLPLNRVIKQIDVSTNESGQMTDDVGLDGDSNSNGVGSYNWDNVSPFANIWCIISCSDSSDILESVTGDRVSVEIIRTCVWRDPVTGGEPDR